MSTRKIETQTTDQGTGGARLRGLAFALIVIVTMGFISALAYNGSVGWLFGSTNAEASIDQTDDVKAAVDPSPTPEETPNPVRTKYGPTKVRLSYEYWGPFDYENFLEREKNGEVPFQGGSVFGDSPYNFLVNNDGGATGAGFFTQSETSLLAFGNTVVVGFNDSGSNASASNKFTGFSRSTDGGATFTDGGTLPTNPGGDAGDPVLGRNDTTGRIYFSTLGFTTSTIQVFRSDDDGQTWQAPVNGTPGGSDEDKQWLAVDNFPGAGNGNVYVMSRRFGGSSGGPGIYMFRSTNNGDTFGPNGGVQITPGAQGAFVAVGPDHTVYAFWFAGATLQVRRSTDQGLTFGPAVTVASGLVGGVNGDLALTGRRNGTTTFSGFRSNEFPHVAINPISGHLYTVFANNPAGTDKADIFFVQSTDGGATWSPAVRVNDDATTTDQWQPTIAVSPTGDRVGFFYYSRQEDPVDNNLFKFWGRIGFVAGSTVTLQPSFAVSDEASLPEFGRDSLINAVYMGDYDQAVATPGYFHVTWSDMRGPNLPGGGDRKNNNVFYKKIPLGLAVASTVPAINSILNVTPTSFVVNFSDPIDPTTVSASDFTVNGIAASGFVINDADTVTFNYGASPVVAQGIQTMAMAAGSVTRLSDGDPLLPFTGTFRYDAVPLNVVSTDPPFPNGVFTLPGPFQYDVTFNEPIDPASVSTTDLTLNGIAGATVTSASVLPGNLTARFTIDVVLEGTLTASIGAGAITDAFGNPGTAFSANYGVDIGTVPYPALAAKEPIGSMIYDPNAIGTVNFAGDTDSFTINLDPNQTISIIVRPTSATLQPRVELFDPANTSLGFASAGAPNQATGIQTRAISVPGVYRIAVSGAAGTTGNYTVQVILNAAFELEGLVPGSNNTVASAQGIDASFINLTTSLASAQRGAVNGTSDPVVYSAAAVTPAFEDIEATGTVIAGLTNQDDASVSVPIPFSFPFFGSGRTAVFVSSNGLLTFGASNTSFTNADLTTTPAQAAIAVFWDDQHTAGGAATSGVLSQRFDAGGPNDRFVIQWNKVRFFSGGTAGDTITYQALLYADGRVQLNYPDLASGSAASNNGASASVGAKAAGTQGPDRLLLAFNNGPNAFVNSGLSTLISPPTPTPDYYSFTASAGDVVTVGAKGLGLTGVTVELRDAADAVLATGAAADNLSGVINNFPIAAGGSYYVRVTAGAIATYNIVVTRNAAFDTEANDAFASPQPLGGNRSALGAIVGFAQYIASNPPTDFEDISATGTRIAALDNQDDASVSVPIGFSFPLYGAGSTDVFVSSNGLLSFGAANTAFTNADLTASPAQAAIAPFWDDQHTGGGTAVSGVYTQVSGTGNDQHLTVQWHQVRFFAGGTAGDTITYQAQLYADGRIRFNYLDLASGTAAGNNGASATVGVKAVGPQGPNRLLLAFNNGPNAFVGTGVSTLIQQPPGEDWYSFNVGPGQTLVEVETSTPGDGPGEFVNNLDPDIELYDPSGALVAGGTTGGDGRNETIVASGLSAAGTYRVRVRADADTIGEYFVSTRVRAETVETLTISTNPVQYSDLTTFTATIQPTEVLGEPPATSVTFRIDGNAVGTVPLVPDGGVLRGTLANYQVVQAAGAHTVTADFASDPDFAVEDPTATLNVTHEDTNVAIAGGYPPAVRVNWPGGNAGPITRCVNITEIDASIGDIDLANVTVSVTPAGPSPAPTQSAVTYDPNTADNTLTACVTFTNAQVNVYDVTFTVGGNYYRGSTSYVLAVFDPKKGFITGGGHLNNPNTGNRMTFGFIGVYLHRNRLIGELIILEHGPGTLRLFTSRVDTSLSIVGNRTGIMLGSGKLNGEGGYGYRLTVVDNGEPGRNDRFGIKITDPSGAPVPELTFEPQTIRGGNIQVKLKHTHHDDHDDCGANGAESLGGLPYPSELRRYMNRRRDD